MVKVVRTHPDKKNLVRAVTVAYRRRDKREPVDVYWKKPLVKEKVSFQRLSILLSAKEQADRKAADVKAKDADDESTGVEN